MFAALSRLFRRTPKTQPDASPVEPQPLAPSCVHVFTCDFDTAQGFANYAQQHWTVDDAEPYCELERDLDLSYLDHNLVELVEGTPEQIDAHVRPLLKHMVDADSVFLGAPSVRQAILIYDRALPKDAPALRSTRQARYIGALELAE